MMTIQRRSLVNMVVAELIELIRDRQHHVGDPLPSAGALAEELDVSRSVVREAIAELAGQGLLTRRQGRETLVALPGSRQLERLIRLRCAVRGDNVGDLQEFRRVLEVGASRLAAERADRADATRLERALSRLTQATAGDDLYEEDQAFHREIAQICGNDMVLLTFDSIAPLLVEPCRLAWTGLLRAGRGRQEVVDAHEAIIERIRVNDPEGAAEAMRRHLLELSPRLEPEEPTAEAVR